VYFTAVFETQKKRVKGEGNFVPALNSAPRPGRYWRGGGVGGPVPRKLNNGKIIRSLNLRLYFLHLINLYTVDESINWKTEFGLQKEHNAALLHFIFS
jgi:hypothetical protein